MTSFRCATLVLAGLAFPALVSSAAAQMSERRYTIEARGGVSVPTFNISDAVDAGPGFGVGAGVRLNSRVWLLGDFDLGFHSGADLPGGGSGPDVKVFHYMAKVGYELVKAEDSPWSVIVNLGAGALTFDVDRGNSYTYLAINAGAKIGYRLSPRVDLLLSPQGDIAFSDEAEVGTNNSWVWPFTAGFRLAL